MRSRDPRRRRALLVAAIGGALLAGFRAEAGVGYQGLLTGTVGVTDNVDSAPSNPPPGSRGRRTDLVTTLTPTLVLGAGNARVVTRLSYSFNAIFFANSRDANSYSNTFRLTMLAETSKRSTVGAGFDLFHGQVSSFNNQADPTDPQAQIQLTRIITTLGINARQSFAYQLSPRARFLESFGFQTNYSFEGGTATALTQTYPGRLGLDYHFPRDTIGLDVLVSDTRFMEQRGPIAGAGGTVVPDGIVSPEQQQLTVSPLGIWRRTMTHFWNVRASWARPCSSNPANPQNKVAEPAGGAGMTFLARLAAADIGYTHTANANLLLRTSNIADAATLRGTFRIGGKNDIDLSLGLVYSFTRQLDSALQVDAAAHLFFGDVTLGYRPLPFLRIFLRYQGSGQLGRPTNPNPVTDFYRNTLLFGISAAYPPALVIDVPQKPLGTSGDATNAPTMSSSKSPSKDQ